MNNDLFITFSNLLCTSFTFSQRCASIGRFSNKTFIWNKVLSKFIFPFLLFFYLPLGPFLYLLPIVISKYDVSISLSVFPNALWIFLCIILKRSVGIAKTLFKKKTADFQEPKNLRVVARFERRTAAIGEVKVLLFFFLETFCLFSFFCAELPSSNCLLLLNVFSIYIFIKK